MTNNKDLIKMTMIRQEKVGTQWKDIEKPSIMNLTLKQFRNSFVEERWEGERRYNKQYTKLGYFHTKTIVYFDSKTRTVRTFEFPK